ncbi:MAG TPA: UDP-glucose 4-epimerase GalE [Aliidongia sp.]|nr:UDP-glucose 4-epimerase GalE [Aliidongia sp.]
MKGAILVAGGAGYIGSHACKALAKGGYQPVVYDDLSHGHEDAVRWGPLVRGDIGDRAHVLDTLRAHRIVAVMHFAAFINVGESMAEPAKYFRNNAAKTFELLDAMAEAGVKRFVFSSTCATYGTPQRLPLDETHPQAPINAYGESKLMGERALAWQHQAHGLRYAALRYFNAAGADPEGELGERHDPETHLIPLVIDAALGRRAAIDIYGTDYPTADGTCIRDYIHVQDLASAHIRAVEMLLDSAPPMALNLGTGSGHSVREVIDAVERVTGLRVPCRERPRRAGDPPVLVADARRAMAVLRWQPEISDIDTIVATAARWARRPTALAAD